MILRKYIQNYSVYKIRKTLESAINSYQNE